MSERVYDDSMAIDSGSGRLHRSGTPPATWRTGVYTCADGMAHLYEQVNREGEQMVRMDTVADGRLYMRTITRTRHHLTDRGIFIRAGRWLRELAEELVL